MADAGLAPRLEVAADALTGAWTAAVPQALPALAALRDTRIISHRGERGDGAAENTFAAFDPLVASSVWGLETDIRFTADGVPVVMHDPDGLRVFGTRVEVARHSAAQLRAVLPQVPTLSEFVRRYAARFHLMLELKAETGATDRAHVAAVMTTLSGLQAGDDYHLMSLTPPLLDHYRAVPESAKISIARFQVAAFSAHVLARGQAALGAHHALLPDHIARRHLAVGQQLALGFPDSRNNLRRQIRRGGRWLFCDRALQVQRWLDQDLERAARRN